MIGGTGVDGMFLFLRGAGLHEAQGASCLMGFV
jgi:hypothetical protein